MKKEELNKERAIGKIVWVLAAVIAMFLTMVTMSEAVYARTPVEERYYGKCLLKHEMKRINKRGGTSNNGLIERGVLRYWEYLEEHTILLKGLIPRATYDISVTFRDHSGNRVTEAFKGIVPADVINVKADDGKPPQISEVKVGPIVKGIFLGTTITWKTDEPATSCVEYGLSGQDGDQRTPENTTLVTEHSAKIHELQRGRQYRFRVRSEDIFGNEAVPEELVFNTENICHESVVEEEAEGKSDETHLAVKKAEIFVLDSDLCLYLQITEPAVVSVEYLKVEDRPVIVNPQLQAGTSNRCTSCHQRK